MSDEPTQYYEDEPNPAASGEVDLNTKGVFRLGDDDTMPFGAKYRGVKMENVPASYLHWMWTTVDDRHNPQARQVMEYIHRNLLALRKEYRDGIWRRDYPTDFK